MAASQVTRWAPIAQQAQSKYGVPADVLLALIQTESSGQEGQVSSANAQGLTQFIPSTAKSYGVDVRPGHAKSQIFGTAKYLLALGFKQNPAKALASYAGGPGNPQYGYARTIAERAKLYQSFAAGQTPSLSGATPAPIRAPSTLAVDNSAARGQLIADFVQGRGNNLDFALGLRALQDQSGAPAPLATSSQAARPAQNGASGDVASVFAKAASVDAERLPYRWGGGHGSAPGKPGEPLDCSGAVSRVLGVSPRVSGAFENFGAPGKGKQVTIYANGGHVLLEINGHFWGTSRTNPGGGAGWIKRSAISPQYLQGFVARHPAGM